MPAKFPDSAKLSQDKLTPETSQEWPSAISPGKIAAIVCLIAIATWMPYGSHSSLLPTLDPQKVTLTSNSESSEAWDFRFGYLEFEWEPGRIPGFGPLRKARMADGRILPDREPE
jgi:hypothetical protein